MNHCAIFFAGRLAPGVFLPAALAVALAASAEETRAGGSLAALVTSKLDAMPRGRFPAAFKNTTPFQHTSSSQGSDNATRSHRWKIELRGGATFASRPAGGTATPLEPAAVLPGLPGGGSSRSVSSWYFGDGAALLNQLVADVRGSGRIAPLDSLLKGAVVQRRHGGNIGLRVSRDMSARVSAELGFDYSLAQLQLTSAGLDGIESSRASFVAAWNGLLSIGPFSQVVTSTKEIRNDTGRQLFMTAAVNLELKTQGRSIPYLSLGAGLAKNRGDAPAASLVGSYRLSSPSGALYNEIDTVRVRGAIGDTAFVGLIGAGLEYRLASRWGARVDVRGYLGKNRVDTLLDAEPVVAAGGPPLSFLTISTSNASVRFSNSAAAPSSLSGPRISGFRSFRGSGMQTQIGATAGFFWRF